jgi:hypothetical protein
MEGGGAATQRARSSSASALGYVAGYHLRPREALLPNVSLRAAVFFRRRSNLLANWGLLRRTSRPLRPPRKDICAINQNLPGIQEADNAYPAENLRAPPGRGLALRAVGDFLQPL